MNPGPEVIKFFHAQHEISTNEEVALSLSDVVLIKLINVKMPTSTGSTPGRYEKLMT